MTFTAGAANHLAFGVQPSNATSGASISPAITVRVLDQFGNLVTGDTSNVSLAITTATGTAGATLSGTTSVNAIGSVATFSGLSIDFGGTGYTLTASDGGLGTATSGAFNIAFRSQTITFGALTDQQYGTAPFTVSASATSGLSVSFASTTPTICTVSGSTVTVVSIGLCTVEASQPGDFVWAAATPVDRSFNVTARTLDITANNQTKVYGTTFTFVGSEFTVGGGQLLPSDSVSSVTLTSAGTVATAAVPGPYAITPSAAVGTGLANYDIHYHNAPTGLTVTKADATISVSGYNVVYDSLPHTATGTAKGVFGETLTGLNLSGTTHTDVVSSIDTWTFTDVTGNYKSITASLGDIAIYHNQVADFITQASTTTSITNVLPEPSTAGNNFSIFFSVTGIGPLTGTVQVVDTYTNVNNIPSTTSCYATVAQGSCPIFASDAGVHTIQVFYLGDGNHVASNSTTRSHTVLPDSSVVGSIAISPTSSVEPAGTPEGYTTTAYDRWGNSLGLVSAALAISPDGSCGTTYCVAYQPGYHGVTATYLTKTAHADLTVTAGPLHHITISPTFASISAGGSQAYYGRGVGSVQQRSRQRHGHDGTLDLERRFLPQWELHIDGRGRPHCDRDVLHRPVRACRACRSTPAHCITWS